MLPSLMANQRNAIKKIRADRKKQSRNQGVRSALHTLERNFHQLISKKDLDKAREFSKALFAKIDKAIGRGILKENTGNRKKSRLAKKLNHLKK